jgi:tetratricopeptide (TPR) repeat protein
VRQAHNLPAEVETLDQLGDVFREMGEARQALDYYKEGLAAARNGRHEATQANSLSNIGLAYQDMDKKWQAIRNLEKGLAQAKKSRMSSAVAAASFKLASVLCQQGKWEKAEPHARLAGRLYAKLGDKQLCQRTSEMQTVIQKNKRKTTGFFMTRKSPQDDQ